MLNFGWGELRAIAGSDMFNLWKPLVPEGIARLDGGEVALEIGAAHVLLFQGQDDGIGLLAGSEQGSGDGGHAPGDAAGPRDKRCR